MSATPDLTRTERQNRDRERRRLQRLSRFMDSGITLPGGFRIGWDGIIGLIPGIGDIVGLGVSAWIVMGAARLGASKVTLARMAGHVLIESLVGAIPIVGDVFDFVYKANDRNMRLLEGQSGNPLRLERHSRRWLLGLAIAAVVGVILVAWLVVSIVAGVLGLIF